MLLFMHSRVVIAVSKSIFSIYCTEACNDFAGLITVSLRAVNTAVFEEMSLRWRAVGNAVSDLTGSIFEAQTSRYRNERVNTRPTGQSTAIATPKINFS